MIYNKYISQEKGYICMASKNKIYVIAPYNNTFAMYEHDDFRIKGMDNVLSGKFKKTDEVKGLRNGYEIGLFECDNGTNYIIFTDHTAIQLIW